MNLQKLKAMHQCKACIELYSRLSTIKLSVTKGIIGVIEGYIGGYIGIMEKKMEATIVSSKVYHELRSGRCPSHFVESHLKSLDEAWLLV